MATRKKMKAKVTQVLNSAKESLKLLELLERETVTKAKRFVKVPDIAYFRKLGIAPLDELESLRLRVEKLEAVIEAHERKHDETKS